MVSIEKILERRLTTEKLLAIPFNERNKATLLEKIKCHENYKYLIETYFTVDAGGKIVPFKLFKYQVGVLNNYIKYPNNITMKTRQMGFTTLTAAYIAAKIINNNNFKVLIISKEMNSSKKFLKLIKDILDEARNITRIGGPDSPSWLIPEYAEDYNNKESFHLTNKSFVEVQGNTDSSGRGFSALDLCIVDEVAFIDARTPQRMNEIWGSIGPALSTVKGRTIMISCVTKDTFVFTNKGIQQIEDFIQHDDTTIKGYEIEPYKIYGHNGFREGNLFKNNGFGKTYKIKTKYTELEAHEDHKIWAYSNGRYDYFKVKELTNNSWLNVKRNMEIWGNNDDVSDFLPTIKKISNKFTTNKITSDIGYFLGLYISEGCMTIKNNSGWIDITCGDPEITNIFNQMKLRWTTNDNLHFRICSKNLIEFMQYLGFKQEKANLKEIPKRLLQCSRKVLIAILQGMFDGDGGINIKNGLNRVVYTSTSEKLINQTRIILANVGILCGKYMWPKENDNPHLDKNGYMIKANFDRYTLELSSIFSDMFVDKIGFRLERKKKIFGKCTSKSFEYGIPNGNEIIDKLYEKGFTGQELRRKYNIRVDNDCITSNKINKIFELLPNDDFKNKAKEEFLFNDNSCWVPIESITENKNYTYDVSLPEIEFDKWCHSVIHNLLNSSQTPKGSAGWYYDTYTNAKNMGFNIIEAHWTVHPMFSLGKYEWIRDDTNPKGGYVHFFDDTWPESLFDKEQGIYIKVDKDKYEFNKDGKIRSPWYDFESAKIGSRKTACELDCSFIGTGGEVFDIDILRNIRLHAESCKYWNIESKQGLLKDYKEFVLPKETGNYALACLPIGELVITKNGNKKIEEVNFNDILINKNGEETNIINIQRNEYDGNIYELIPSNTFEGTKFTNEHPILISKKEETIINQYKKSFFNFNFIKTENIKVGDWVQFPNIYKNKILSNEEIYENFEKYCTNYNWKINPNIILENDFWWYCGIWLAEGFCSKVARTYKIRTCHNKNESEIIEKIINISNKLFNRNGNKLYNLEESNINVEFSNTALANFLLDNFGSGANNKKLSEFIKCIPEKYKIQLIKGFWEGDGNIKTNKKLGTNCINFVSSSHDLLYDIQDMLFSIGCISSLSATKKNERISYINNRKINGKRLFYLTVGVTYSNILFKKFDLLYENKLKRPPCNNYCFFSEDQTIIYLKIKKINISKYKGIVCNFETEDHTYLSPRITHHNCDVSTGDGSDFSTISILDLNSLEICGSYVGQLLPHTFAKIIAEIGYRFNTAIAIVENAGGGGTTLQELKDMKYPKIYYSTLNKKDESLGISKRKIGLWVSESVRDKGGDKLEEYIRTNRIKIPDIRYSNEFYNWIWDRDGKRRHAPGKHDDLIISLQHVIYYHAYVYKRNARNRENFSKMFDIQTVGNFNGIVKEESYELEMHEIKRNNGKDIIEQKRNFYKNEKSDKPDRLRFFL